MEQIQSQTGIHTDVQRLICNGKKLEKTCKLMDYSISESSVIRLVVRSDIGLDAPQHNQSDLQLAIDAIHGTASLNRMQYKEVFPSKRRSPSLVGSELTKNIKSVALGWDRKRSISREGDAI